MCGGTGRASYIRKGEWLNGYCPWSNGPVDADDYPDGQEIDCLAEQRFARLEYKRPGESVPVGQAKHLRALHEMVSKGWEVLLLVVVDEGQSDGGQQVRFSWCSSRGQWQPPSEWMEHRTTLDALARSVVGWVWSGTGRPVFLLPPPPACGACGVLLPRTPQQTIPVDGVNMWVCLDCFYLQRGALKAAREQAEEEARLMAEAEVMATAEESRMERLV